MSEVTITGPFAQDGTQDGPATQLVILDESTADTDTETNTEDIPGNDDEGSFLAPLDGILSVSYNGKFNPTRLREEGFGGPGNPKSAVRQYLIEIERLTIPTQGAGYKLDDNVNGISRDPTAGDIPLLIEETEWSFSAGEGLSGQWRVDGVLNEGVQSKPPTSRGTQIGNELSQVTDGITPELVYNGNTLTLGSNYEVQYNRVVDINAQNVMFNENVDIPAVGVIETGVKGTLRVSGEVSLNSTAPLSAWASALNRDAHGKVVDIKEPVTGRTFTGAISTSSASAQADAPRQLEYDIELKIGDPDSFSL